MEALEYNNKESLIKKWKLLKRKSDRLLAKHEDFRKYNAVRNQMDTIETRLHEEYGVDAWSRIK